MNALRRVATIIDYEWRRALAKKKILVLIIFAVVVQILPFVAYTQILDWTAEAKATMWVLGALGGQNLFIQLVAIIIAGGSMSEEYEQERLTYYFQNPLEDQNI